MIMSPLCSHLNPRPWHGKGTNLHAQEYYQNITYSSDYSDNHDTSMLHNKKRPHLLPHPHSEDVSRLGAGDRIYLDLLPLHRASNQLNLIIIVCVLMVLRHRVRRDPPVPTTTGIRRWVVDLWVNGPAFCMAARSPTIPLR